MSHPLPKIAFVSPHCLVDFTNGAATATRDGLVFLQSLGFACEAFCSSRLDSWEEVLVEELLAQRGLPYQVRNARIGAFRGRMIFTAYRSPKGDSPISAGREGDSPVFAGTKTETAPGAKTGTVPLPVTLFNSASTRGGWVNREETAAFLAACETFLERNRPDLVWTYGGDPVALAVQRLAKQHGIPVLFALHNLSYRDLAPFQMVDRVLVPGEFAQRHYREKLGLECDVLPLAVDPGRVKVERDSANPRPSPLPEDEGTFVTFVNPTPLKGVFVFARIAEVLSKRRPDIPLLLVEGSSKTKFLPQLGIDPGLLKNVRVMRNTPDARRFLAATRVLLMPSLMENAALLAIEAMTNGIPVLASNRGGLPQTIGSGGFLFDIPARYTSETREVPTAEEVAPWVETIIRLWDDAAEYERYSRAARERAQAWHPDRLAPLYRDFFSRIISRHSLPLAPRAAVTR